MNKFFNRFIERRSYAVLLACFSFIGGIILHSAISRKLEFFWSYNALLVLIILYFYFFGKRARLIILAALFFILGFARYDLAIKDEKSIDEFLDKETSAQAIVLEEPSIKSDKQQIAAKITAINDNKIDIAENVLITANLYPQFEYGDKIEFSCKLNIPKTFEDFDYARYLSIQNVYAVCYYPEIKLISKNNNNFFKSQLLKVKNFFISKINEFLSEPYASFLSGLIVGARSGINAGITEDFRRTGLSHIIAISGWNITFLGVLLLPMLFALRVKRGTAFYVLTIIIFLFVAMVGFSPSVLRAGIMGAIALFAQRVGRQSSAGRALLYSATIMLAINPKIIFDAGFHLSLFATFGILYLGPIVERKSFIGKIYFTEVKEILKTTISASIFTLPISSYIFGGVSLFFLPANILILPFLAIAIAISLVALIASFIHSFVALLIFIPSISILDFILEVAHFFGKLPFAFVDFKLPFLLLPLLYGGLIFLIIKYGSAKKL